MRSRIQGDIEEVPRMEHTSFDFVLKKVPLSSDETMLGKWYASRLIGGLSMHGGQIILTSSRVIFLPINTDGLL